jgi:hypothetical protein
MLWKRRRGELQTRIDYLGSLELKDLTEAYVINDDRPVDGNAVRNGSEKALHAHRLGLWWHKRTLGGNL